MGWGITLECRGDGRLGRIFTTLCIVGALLSQLSGIEWLNCPSLSLPSPHLAKPHKRDTRWLYVCVRGPLDTPSQTL